MVFSKEITAIDDCAFENSISTNTNIYYTGTQSEWNDITISNTGNAGLNSARVYFYSEEQPTTSGYYWHFVDGGVPTPWVLQ